MAGIVPVSSGDAVPATGTVAGTAKELVAPGGSLAGRACCENVRVEKVLVVVGDIKSPVGIGLEGAGPSSVLTEVPKGAPEDLYKSPRSGATEEAARGATVVLATLLLLLSGLPLLTGLLLAWCVELVSVAVTGGAVAGCVALSVPAGSEVVSIPAVLEGATGGAVAGWEVVPIPVVVETTGSAVAGWEVVSIPVVVAGWEVASVPVVVMRGMEVVSVPVDSTRSGVVGSVAVMVSSASPLVATDGDEEPSGKGAPVVAASTTADVVSATVVGAAGAEVVSPARVVRAVVVPPQGMPERAVPAVTDTRPGMRLDLREQVCADHVQLSQLGDAEQSSPHSSAAAAAWDESSSPL